MTNIEYYGVDRLEFYLSNRSTDENKFIDVYYNPKHSPQKFKVGLILVQVREETIREEKVKWLLKEVTRKKFTDLSGKHFYPDKLVDEYNDQVHSAIEEVLS